MIVSELALSNRSVSADFYLATHRDDGSHSLSTGVPAQSIAAERVSGELANYVAVPEGGPLLDRLEARLPALLRPA